MLKPEQAEEQLKKLRSKRAEEARTKRVRDLPAELSRLAFAFLDADPEGKPLKNWQARQTARQAAGRALDQLKPEKRLRLFAALFPTLAPHMESTWQLLKRCPYQTGYLRKSFRAPSKPEYTLSRRLDWLDSMLSQLGRLPAEKLTPEWLASWAAFITEYGSPGALGYLLAGILEPGGADSHTVFEILCDSARNQHAIGRMGAHVVQALLLAAQPAGWEFIEKLLLAAQRQEGLRQSILETADEAHPGAFRRLLRVIQEHNLTRFASIIRAMDVWVGEVWTVAKTKEVQESLATISKNLEDPEACREALKSGDGEAVYFALWAQASVDAVVAAKSAAELLQDRKVERRYAATRLLGMLKIPEAVDPLLKATADADLRVAYHAYQALPWENQDEEYLGECTPTDRFFPVIEALLARIPEDTVQLKPLVWIWNETAIDRENVADSLSECVIEEPASKLIPFLSQMSSYGRYSALTRLTKNRKTDAETRALLFQLVSDRDTMVREEALRIIKRFKVTPEEGQQLEAALTRKSEDSRRAVLDLLLRQKDKLVFENVDRLLLSKKVNQRLAALELLRLLIEDKREVARCREKAEQFRTSRGKLGEAEAEAVDLLLNVERKKATLDDALGLLDVSQLSPRIAPTKKKVRFITPAAIACLRSLEKLIGKHRDTPISMPRYDAADEEEESRTVLLGDYGLTRLPDYSKPLAEDLKDFALREVWEKWYRERPASERDADGLELIRAMCWCQVDEWEWNFDESPYKDVLKKVASTIAGGQKPFEAKYTATGEILRWLERSHPTPRARDFLLEATEATLALLSEKDLAALEAISLKEDVDEDWRTVTQFTMWLEREGDFHEERTPEEKKHRWQLLHWLDQPTPKMPRNRPDLDALLDAMQLGVANEADLIDQLLGPRDTEHWYSANFNDLESLTSRTPPPAFKNNPNLAGVVDRCRQRILEVELQRGESPTAATLAARALNSLTGLEVLVQLLTKMGTKKLRNEYAGQSRTSVLTYLMCVTFPGEGDTPTAFREKVGPLFKQGVLTPDRLLELAFLAPQWVPHVVAIFGWPGLEEAIWWFLAHMANSDKGYLDDSDWDETRDEPVVSEWTKMVRQRTTLTEEEREEGAVDVEWFRQVFAPVGWNRWELIAEAAKIAATGPAARKAKYLSEVLLGKAKKSDIVRQIRNDKAREAVRLIGLLPLKSGSARTDDLLSRYRVLHEYRRYARSLSPMSREATMQAFSIGLANLARTAGFADPIRLEWEMEREEVADLAAGPVEHSHLGVTVQLSLDDQGKPDITVRRGEKTLKAIPPKVRKHRKIAVLVERKAELKRQASRIRESLEQFMCRGDEFTGEELQKLFAHPMLAPLLGRLVVIGQESAGYPVEKGARLQDVAGRKTKISPTATYRLAHPCDFHTRKDWAQWQHECFVAERLQPFKQVFRELYVLTEQERSDRLSSSRYAGHQVNPNQARALFASRGWQFEDEAQKTFAYAGMVAFVDFQYGVTTPLEVEGLTVSTVRFVRRGEYTAIPLDEVPPRIFSEVMRDVDLVVSVAHVGGVDPEASASTVEMRASLVQETCQLLGIKNVRVQKNLLLIDGQLNHYSIHLGSGTVHRQPGGHLCIVPVHAQHRGRLFLPFADDDPRTAEVISKMLLLARDQEIQDPTILAQLHSRP